MNLGRASAVAFLLFLIILAMTRCCCASPAQGAVWRRSRRIAAVSVAGECRVGDPGMISLAPLAWMVSVSSWRRARPALSAALLPDAATLENYGVVPAHRHRQKLRQQRAGLGGDHPAVAIGECDGRLCLRQAALRRP